MAKISGATPIQIVAAFDAIAAKAGQAKSFEEAAQLLTDSVSRTFSESVVLSRVFATVPMQSLPADNAKWVTNLAQSKGVAAELAPTTQVLSLVASSGSKPNWNGRKKSQGHVGIPLYPHRSSTKSR